MPPRRPPLPLLLALLLCTPAAAGEPPAWARPALARGSAEWIDLPGEGALAALFAPAVGAKPAGGVVLIADRSDQPGSSPVIAPLMELRRHGWSAVAPALPEPPPLPARPLPPPRPAEPPAGEAEPAGGEPGAAADPKAPAQEPPKEAPKEPPAKPEEKEKPAQEGKDGKEGKEGAEPGAEPPPAAPPPPPTHIGPGVAAPLPDADAAFLDAARPRIAGAVARLKQQGIHNIVLVGHGRGAVAALLHAVERPGEVQGLVLISLPLLSGADPRLASDKLLEQVKVATLDLFGEREEPEVTATGDRRRLAAARHLLLAPPAFGRTGAQPNLPGPGAPIYRQVVVPEAGHHFRGFEDQLMKRVRGWLERHARGEEAKAKRDGKGAAPGEPTAPPTPATPAPPPGGPATPAPAQGAAAPVPPAPAAAPAPVPPAPAVAPAPAPAGR